MPNQTERSMIPLADSPKIEARVSYYYHLTLLTSVYCLYHLGRCGKKETFVCCTSECLGRRDVVQR